MWLIMTKASSVVTARPLPFQLDENRTMLIGGAVHPRGSYIFDWSTRKWSEAGEWWRALTRWCDRLRSDIAPYVGVTCQ